jgi:7-carboxy-7-deazaguanine synthase
MSVDEVVERVGAYGCDVVEITGGEPLLQKDVYPLMERLLADGRMVMLETGGHRSVSAVPPGVRRIIDVKCPGSGESEKNCWGNLDDLRATDEVKFVIRDRTDYEYARQILRERGLQEKCAAVLFSPVHGVMNNRELAEWILEDRLPVRLQLQAHKYIWDPSTRGV